MSRIEGATASTSASAGAHAHKNMRRRLSTLLPPVLVAAYALWTFWPDRASMPGGEAFFNLWTFEHVWRQMDRLGPLHLWSDRFWTTPIFAGTPLGLAFSENQIYPALLLRPLWHAFGGVVALSIGAIVFTLAAFGSAFGWLRKIGLQDLASGGALMFACCGFVQSQYVHYQNLSIFLLPLALWSWAALADAPGPLRAALCALAFGWMAGWNIYFQLFADLLLLVLALLPNGPPRRWRVAALMGAALIQLPIVLKYLELQRLVGTFAVSTTYGALPQSFLATAARPTLLQAYLPGYPHIQVPFEAAGLLGFCWTALLVAALWRPRARVWAVAALLAFWAALGLGYGLFDLLHLLPGFSGLRASGRFQVLTALFAVPAALLVLDDARGVLRWLPLAVVAMELIPAGPAHRIALPPDLGRHETAFDAAVARAGPLLAVPALDPRFQLYSVHSGVPFLQGSSGRAPANVELLDAIFSSMPWTPASLHDLLDLTRAPLVATTDPVWAKRLSASPLLEARGCFEHYDLLVCLFRSRSLPDTPRLSLDQDARWEHGTSPEGWPVALLRTTRAGILDYGTLGRCRLRETTRIGPLRWTRELPFPGGRLQAVRFETGQVALARESRQGIFRWARAARTYAVQCG